VFPYAGVIGDMIRNMKYQGGEAGAGALARLSLAGAESWFAQLRSRGEPDIVVPVPLHLLRLFRRSFNQSALLARELSAVLECPLEEFAVRRVRRTPPQARRAGREQRLKNMAGAFHADPRLIEGKSVLLVDDVMTTGATLASCGVALREAGARRVYGFAVARGGGHGRLMAAPAEMTLLDANGTGVGE